MNSVRLELLKMDRQWYGQVKGHADKPLFVCLGEKHGLKLFDAYFKSRSADGMESRDLFLTYYRPFDDAREYGRPLLADLQLAYALWREENGVSTPCEEWRAEGPEAEGETKTDAGVTAKALMGFYDIFPPMRGRKVFILLSPQRIGDASLFELWLKEWCDGMEGDDIKLVVTEQAGARLLRNLPESRHEFTLNPTDIASLMNNVAAQTSVDPNGGESVLQQQMLLANAHFCKGEFDAAHVALDKAATIAGRHGLVGAACAAHLLKAYVWLIQGDEQRADIQFRTLLTVAGGDTSLAAQMHTNYAGFLLATKRKDKALAAFGQAAEISKAAGNLPLEMECHRIMGQLQDGRFSDSKAVAHYERCLDIGESMSETERRQGSLAYIASLLLAKYGNTAKGDELRKRMEQGLGADWQTDVKPPQMESSYYSPYKETPS